MRGVRIFEGVHGFNTILHQHRAISLPMLFSKLIISFSIFEAFDRLDDVEEIESLSMSSLLDTTASVISSVFTLSQ